MSGPTVSVIVKSGKYSATLRLGADRRSLHWYFPGADRRRNGDGASIDLGDIAAFDAAVAGAYEEYERFQAAIPADVEASKTGMIGDWKFQFSCGSFGAGLKPFGSVSTSPKHRIASREDLADFRGLLTGALSKAVELAGAVETPAFGELRHVCGSLMEVESKAGLQIARCPVCDPLPTAAAAAPARKIDLASFLASAN